VAGREIPIETGLGSVCIHERGRGDGPPVVFLHGVFLDSSLWDRVAENFRDHRLLLVDMPGHGKSHAVGRAWSLDECAGMLFRVLDGMGVERCVAVGHSWGAMAALRAAVQRPNRFRALCLANMPFRKTTGLRRVGFHIQKLLAAFRGFYAKQAVKALYTPQFLAAHPRIAGQMEKRLRAMSRREIARVVNAVLLEPGDAGHLIKALQVPALYVVGQGDYVGVPKDGTLIVPGGHISPHEAPEELKEAILRFLSNRGFGFR
jgi:3-oxoadipate enol-lactonase